MVLISVCACAEPPKLPSRHAETVVTLLHELKPKPKLSEIQRILGKEDIDIGSAQRDLLDKLDDLTSIEVISTLNDDVTSIIRTGKNIKDPQILYKRTKDT